MDKAGTGRLRFVCFHSSTEKKAGEDEAAVKELAVAALQMKYLVNFSKSTVDFQVNSLCFLEGLFSLFPHS